MKKRYYKLKGFCKDCTGVDFQGCNDGQPFDLGNFTKENYAFDAGNNFVGDCPYYFEVQIIEVQSYIYDALIFEK